MKDYDDNDDDVEKDSRRERFERKRNYTEGAQDYILPRQRFESRVPKRQPYKRTKINYDDLLDEE